MEPVGGLVHECFNSAANASSLQLYQDLLSSFFISSRSPDSKGSTALYSEGILDVRDVWTKLVEDSFGTREAAGAIPAPRYLV